MNVKGSALRARVLWARQKGDAAYAKLLAALTPETRAIVESSPMVNSWYPFEAFIEINEVLDRQHGSGNLALCLELGRHGCDVNLKTLYKFFFRIGSVGFIVRRAAAAWKVNYDEGWMEVVENESGHVILRVLGVPKPHRAHCLSVRGWIERACELSGGEIVERKERCRVLGDAACEFEFRWK